jgi:hypothetical protein
MIRASLLATAATTTLNGRRWRRALIHVHSSPDRPGRTLTSARLQHLPGPGRDSVILDLGKRRQQLAHPGLALRRHEPEFGEMPAQGVDRRGALADQLVAQPVQHQQRLLVRALDRNEPHARALHRLAARRGVRGVVLVGLDVGLDVLRRTSCPSLVSSRAQ